MNQVGNEISDDIKIKIFGILEENEYVLGLCHNDLQPNNMLKTDLGIVIIDYEFSTVGNILFDIANLFCETHLNYEENVYYLSIGYQKEDEERFIGLYFDEKVDLKEIYSKVENLKIISHFLWFFWAIPKAKGEGTQDFDYVKYAKERLREIEKIGILNNEEIESLLSLL
jgi:thiamine kinase-like enzyme